jgi:threonine/homoserine/homoserine lactone efflux protein
MLYLQVFLVGLVFSFLGSIPPGTLNLCVLQLGLEKKISVALRFALAVAIVEYPYTWIGVQFEYWITSSPWVVRNFQLVTAVVMTAMGVLNIWSARNPTSFSVKFNASGFRRGIVLSILNPMAIPFWIGVTAYLKSQGWIDLSTTGLLHTYVLGTSVGAMILLTLYTFLANRLSVYIQNSRVVQLVPGVTLLLLGVYAFWNFFRS